LYFFERWKKTALLVFSALAFVSAKTKCAVCAVGFFSMLPNGGGKFCCRLRAVSLSSCCDFYASYKR
jgi:hypothetical protein